MESRGSASGGFIDSLRGVGDSLLGSLQDRLELLSIEVQEEKFRLIQLIIWVAAAVFAGVMTLLMASVTVAYFFWTDARLGVLLGLTGLYAVLLVVIIVGFRRMVARQPKPFAGTLEEIKEDRACIRRRN
ncbi:MAG: phage holin family protein [Verrucomicrobia bacterium]|nr:phage holin family protein [Verrucomicrobiota bacterium]